MKKIFFITLLNLAAMSPALAGPAMSFASAPIPYGSFACKQRAENKLASLGATNISRSPGAATVWGDSGEFTVGIWCRSSEAVIFVAGPSSTAELRDDVKSAF